MGAVLSNAELLTLEEEQLYHFLTDIRPVGEEKSELYPEPKYFHVSFQTCALTFAELRKSISNRMDAAELGRFMRRPLSRCTALHSSGSPFITTWGRQMWLDLHGRPEPGSGLIAKVGDIDFTDDVAADDLRFWYEAGCAYRQDGWAYPARDRGLGADYRILDQDVAEAFAHNAQRVDSKGARDVIQLWATVRALSFLMEAETRDALMMHGPYPLSGGRCFVMFECNDLNWRLWPEFPIPGQRWEIPDKGFAAGDISIGLVLRNVEVQADRMGTLYVTPWSADNVEAATLLTRGPDEWADGELRTIDVKDAAELASRCDATQDSAFLQLAEWSTAQALAAGHCQKFMIMLRTLAGSGATEAEIRAHFDRYKAITELVWERDFERILNAGPEDLPYYTRLNDFVLGKTKSVFTPFSGAHNKRES